MTLSSVTLIVWFFRSGFFRSVSIPAVESGFDVAHY